MQYEQFLTNFVPWKDSLSLTKRIQENSKLDLFSFYFCLKTKLMKTKTGTFSETKQAWGQGAQNYVLRPSSLESSWDQSMLKSFLQPDPLEDAWFASVINNFPRISADSARRCLSCVVDLCIPDRSLPIFFTVRHNSGSDGEQGKKRQKKVFIFIFFPN